MSDETNARPTRWALASLEEEPGYAARFAQAVEDGEDVDGEARLADAMLARGGLVLDAGSGMGRVSAGLIARGHRVTALEPDPALVAQSRATYPDLAVVADDILGFDPSAVGAPTAYDLIVCVGNVLVFLAEGSEVEVLSRLRHLLAPGGRVLAGFHTAAVRPGARDYDPDDFVADAHAAGLAVAGRYGTYELHPPLDDYAVWILTAQA